jgi:phospholipase C
MVCTMDDTSAKDQGFSANRRNFMQLLGSGALAAAMPASIARALAIPANNATGTIADVQHVVVLMQENRSFDHYFGTLRGVRGYSDPRAATLASGASVWQQPDGKGGYVMPFHPTAKDLGLVFLEDLAHDWNSTHAAWNNGNWDQWVPSKGTTTMAHYVRNDIPFHYALADAFTVCDAYHCSIMGPTDPNRYHMWTGYVGNDGKGGGPVLDNAEAGYGWSTYPERLQAAGIAWKIYQDVGTGLTADGYWGWTDNAYIGNYGDNSLLYFHQYQRSKPGSALYQGALQGTNISEGGTLFDDLIHDINNNTLPQVSWIVAPEAYCEHPNWPPNYGAWYISQVIDALTAKPEVWSKTVLLITFDENDGFFDHMIPATPPQSRAEGLSSVSLEQELFPGNSEFVAGPIGLGPRVPMLVLSPWSKGGYVNSQVFDHTSVIRFIQAVFGPNNPALVEHNITKWRQTVTGDLTSCFNFKTPNAGVVPLPSTAAYVPPNQNRHDSYVPAVPARQALPQQEPGMRFARALPYEFQVQSGVDLAAGVVALSFENLGSAGAVFQVRSGNGAGGPWTYTVAAGKTLHDTWPVTASGMTAYDLSVSAPNGFLRQYKGTFAAGTSANLAIAVAYDKASVAIGLTVTNHGPATTVTIVNSYTGETAAQTLQRGESFASNWALLALYGWYDMIVTVDTDSSFAQRLSGHVETGRDSASDPAIGGLGQG